MMNATTGEEVIVVKLVETNVLTRWPCTVCGGSTEKVPVLAEAAGTGIRVCEFCLEAGDMDAALQAHASRLEADARAVRALVGRVQVPTFAEWEAAMQTAGAPHFDD